jgi:hypothetical protein
MEGVNDPKYSKSEVSQKFNLKKLLGYEPTDYQKELFFELVAERIVERTSNGKDINGSKFTRYSEDYAEKKGVSRDSVDLILEGDMLQSFEPEAQKNIVKIKMADGVETLKAYNHNVGDTLPQRTFFGITKDNELKRIIKAVDQEKPSKSEKTTTERAVDLAELRRAIQETIDLEIEGFDGNS